MADHRIDPDRTLPGSVAGMNLTPETDPEHLIPERTHAAAPGTIGATVGSDPDAVRDEIERTRERMSRTIGDIEGALMRKKGEIQDRLDFVAPVREKPWIFAAGVFGTGLVLGLLTGGGGDDDRDHVKVPRALLAGLDPEGDGDRIGNGRASANGGGQRELLNVIARQEEEIRDLRAALYGDDEEMDAYAVYAGDEGGADALGDVDVADEWDEDWNFDDEGDGPNDFGAFGVEEGGGGRGVLGRLVTGVVAAGLAAAISRLGKKALAGREELQVEVEMEPEEVPLM